MTTTVHPQVVGPAQRARRLPEAWLRASLAGIEAALISWLLVVVPTVAAYVATAAAPLLGEASWDDAAVIGTGLWLLGHGASVELGDVATVSLTPLGTTLVSALLVYGGARRARLRRPATAAFALAGYTLTVLGLSALVTGPVGRPVVALCALLVAGLALALALRRARAPRPAWWLRLLDALPDAVRAGVRAGWMTLAVLLALAVLALSIALVQGVVTVLELHEALAPGRMGTVVLVLGQLAFLPTMVVWALAWIAGPGFAVGQGTLFSPSEVITAPLPAVPALGVLPDPATTGLGWVVLLPVLAGAGAGWWLHRRRFQDSWWQAALSGVVTAATVAVVGALLTVAAAGGIGPGRLATVGASAPAVAGALAWQVAAGAVVVLLVLHPQVHAGVARAYRRIVRRTDDGGARTNDDGGAGTSPTPPPES
ncbi:hypothetical protein FE251_12695 [Georgenia wutianyii]|uniref:Cytochrome d ubiquinol oxidase subunit II n=1 Tax=Georgenia wutianyii TaxID=2585135 RepID=A0ABX5VSI6_9MICO|nr:DUF6350 family protein [Georgenia wutianyii]QDB80144.1 hypothetical protein FE251_12695 [Georgenia wutianyii]